MSKVIQYGKDAEYAIVKGIDAVANIVKTTVGPRGRNVIIREQMSPPFITNDGVTIAKSIELKDKIEDAGAQLMIQVANRTNDIAGDGTSSTTVLAQEMIHKFYEFMEDETIARDINPVQVQKDMIKTANFISDYLKSIAVEINDKESLERVASISSGSDEIGKLIANAFDMAGEYGSVITEDSKTGIDNLVTINGMKLTNGSISQFLLLDRANRKTDLRDVDLIITKDKIESVTDVISILDDCNKSRRKLLILCEDCEMDVINTIVANKMRGATLDVSIVRMPGYGEIKDNIIDDICVATGATKIGRDYGIPIKDFKPEYLGQLEQVTVTMDDTIIKFKDVSNNGEDLLAKRNERVSELKAQLEVCKKEEQQSYRKRISYLTDGIAIIEVGGNSDVEIKDKKLRIEDAINSVQSAKEEGIVPGGGYSFLLAVINAPERVGTVGERIVYNSLEAVTRQIAENAGFDGPMTVATCYNKHLGFNALTGEYENLLETGVINSVKVDRYSVINATSVASTVITMGGVITDENEKDQNVLQLAGPMPMMM